MQTFGVAADVDLMSRRRRVTQPLPEPTKAQMGLRAAQYGDIVDLVGKKHFPAEGQTLDRKSARDGALETVDIDHPAHRRKAQNRSKAAGGVLPYNSETYDMNATAAPRHRYFDQSFHAQRYAELIGRPGGNAGDGDLLEGMLLELTEGEPLPLAFRRVLRATMPASSNPDFQGRRAEQLRNRVEKKVLRQCTVRKSGASVETQSTDVSLLDAMPEEVTIGSTEMPSVDTSFNVSMDRPRKEPQLHTEWPAWQQDLPTLLGGHGHSQGDGKEPDMHSDFQEPQKKDMERERRYS